MYANNLGNDSSAGQLGQSQSPQNVASQGLSGEQAALQQTQGDVLTMRGSTISSVGSADFSPITNVSSASSAASSDSSSAMLYVTGAGLVLLAFVAIVTLAIKKGAAKE